MQHSTYDFREASNIICSYGNRILDVQVASVRFDNWHLSSFPGCQGPDVPTQTKRNLHLLLDAESCAMWLLCEFRSFQVSTWFQAWCTHDNLVFCNQVQICKWGYVQSCLVGLRILRFLLIESWNPRLYGDEALDNALNTFVTLLLSIPQVLNNFVVNLVLKMQSSPRLTYWTTPSCPKPTMCSWSVSLRTTWPSLPP